MRVKQRIDPDLIDKQNEWIEDNGFITYEQEYADRLDSIVKNGRTFGMMIVLILLFFTIFAATSR